MTKARKLISSYLIILITCFMISTLVYADVGALNLSSQSGNTVESGKDFRMVMQFSSDADSLASFGDIKISYNPNYFTFSGASLLIGDDTKSKTFTAEDSQPAGTVTVFWADP
ncbi:MAG: hypothetical protein PHT04_05270, partial [Eubacteriales bacterium]|nr:hypothetical protein [Eubacteriales bacterium]